MRNFPHNVLLISHRPVGIWRLKVRFQTDLVEQDDGYLFLSFPMRQRFFLSRSHRDHGGNSFHIKPGFVINKFSSVPSYLCENNCCANESVGKSRFAHFATSNCFISLEAILRKMTFQTQRARLTRGGRHRGDLGVIELETATAV
jgi:hypothetical protein